MGWGFLQSVLTVVFNILSWPSFTVVCPLYASFCAMESANTSRYQQCLTFWVLFAFFTILEQALAEPLNWFPSWPYVKGLATVLLVIPYFGGASYAYSRLLRPYICEDLLKWGSLLIIGKPWFSFLEQEGFSDAVDADIVEDGQELETVIYQEIFKPSNDNKEWEQTWSTSRKKVQKEWSCALCLVSTTSEKCLKKHLRGKVHKANEENLRLEQLAMKAVSNQTFMFGNLVDLEKLRGLMHPVARSIRLCRWEKPEFGCIKLNTDGSLDKRAASLGGLLRDCNGYPICAFVSKAPGDDIFSVELMAVWRGLVLALGLGIKVVWVESDSESVVETINRKRPYGGKSDGCLKHIWLLLKEFNKYRVSHSWREANRAADHLSKMVVHKNDVVLLPEDFPVILQNIIKDDAQGLDLIGMCTRDTSGQLEVLGA